MNTSFYDSTIELKVRVWFHKNKLSKSARTQLIRKKQLFFFPLFALWWGVFWFCGGFFSVLFCVVFFFWGPRKAKICYVEVAISSPCISPLSSGEALHTYQVENTTKGLVMLQRVKLFFCLSDLGRVSLFSVFPASSCCL